MEIIELSNENFEELINKGACLVDFYADWCGPCKMMAPVLEELKDKIQIIKVNTDKHQQLSMKYGIMSIPTLILFKDGKEHAKKIGLTAKDELEEIIAEII